MTYSTLKKGLTGALVLGGLCALLPATQDAAAQAIGARKLDNMLVATPQKLERGKAVYAQNCAQCHGDNGQGGAEFGQQFDPPARGFADAVYNYGGGKVAIYEAISKKGIVPGHPVFGYLAYQDRWAVTHYVRSVGPTETLTDSAEALERAYFEAENGYCQDEIKQTLASKVEFKGEEQLKVAEEIYGAQCASCHGDEGKGDGAAAAALNPPPRNFTSAEEEWYRTSSPLSIFNTLANGARGSMAAYPNLSEDEKWALAHYIREKWVPPAAKKDATDEQVTAVCRTLSAPPKPPAIPVNAAMKFLVEDQPEQRRLEYTRFGAAYVSPTANAQNGASVYTAYCAECHGPNGSGLGAGDPNADNLGPHGAFPPYLYLRVNRLIPAKAGGTVKEFATRSMAGVHTTLPNMTAASTLTNTQWTDLHAYVTGFEGEGEVVVGPKPNPAAPQPVLGPDGQPLLGPDGQPVMQVPTEEAADEETAATEQPAAAQPAAAQPAAAAPAAKPAEAAPAKPAAAAPEADSSGSSNGQQ